MPVNINHPTQPVVFPKTLFFKDEFPFPKVGYVSILEASSITLTSLQLLSNLKCPKFSSIFRSSASYPSPKFSSKHPWKVTERNPSRKPERNLTNHPFFRDFNSLFNFAKGISPNPVDRLPTKNTKPPPSRAMALTKEFAAMILLASCAWQSLVSWTKKPQWEMW